jgi:hypothetical protein
MRAKHVTIPPPVVIVFVACLPVALLAFAVILTHLMHADERAAISAGEERTLQAALDAERAARLQAEADRDTARAEAADTAVREAALAQQAERLKADAEHLKSDTPKPTRTRRKTDAASPSSSPSASPGADDIDAQAEALSILAAEPDIAGSELGRRLGFKPSYGRTLKRRLTETVPGGGG